MPTLTINETSVKEWLWLLAHWRWRFRPPGPVTIEWPDGTQSDPLPVRYRGVSKGCWQWQVVLVRAPEHAPDGATLSCDLMPPRTTLTFGPGAPPFRVALTPRDRRWMVPLAVAVAVYMNVWLVSQVLVGGSWWMWLWTLGIYGVWLGTGPRLLRRYRRSWLVRVPADAPILLATCFTDAPECRTEQLTPKYEGYWDDPDGPRIHLWTVRMHRPHADYEVVCKALQPYNCCTIRSADGVTDMFDVSTADVGAGEAPKVLHKTWISD